jgi:hypothetical protein
MYVTNGLWYLGKLDLEFSHIAEEALYKIF